MDRISRRQVENSERFYRIPKALFEDDLYGEMKLESKMAYAILKDRAELSLKNNWFDKQGDIFLIYKNKDLQKILQAGEKKIISIKKELSKFGLLEEERQGLNKPNRLYIGNLNITEKVIHKDKPLSDREPSKRQFQNWKNDSFGTAQMTGQELSKRQSSDTEKSDTNLSDTENNDSFDEDDDIITNQSENSNTPKKHDQKVIACADKIQSNPNLRPIILDNFSNMLVEDPQTMLTVIQTIISEQTSLQDLLKTGNTYLKKMTEKLGVEQGLTFILNQAIVSQIEYMQNQLQNYTYFATYFAKGLTSRIQILCHVATNRLTY